MKFTGASFFLILSLIMLLGCSKGGDGGDDQSSDSSNSQKSSSTVADCPNGDAHALPRLSCYQAVQLSLNIESPVNPALWDQLPASDFALAAPEISACRSLYPAACL